MSDERIVTLSTTGFKQFLASDNGKGLHWVCDVNAEIPIKMTREGEGAEKPTTLPLMFLNAVKTEGERNSLLV